MIALTRLDGTEFILNADHILTVERTPDTVIVTTHGQHFMVREPLEAVVARVVSFRRQIQHGPLVVDPTSSAGPVEG
jgi:flagellar protein FlbD